MTTMPFVVRDGKPLELDLYKRYASDPDFKRAFDASIFRMLSSKDIGSQLGMGSM